VSRHRTVQIRLSGYATTTQEIEFSVKVEAAGLQPYTKYYYRFQSCAAAELGTSPVGSFKTLPDEDTTPEQIRIAFFSCSNCTWANSPLAVVPTFIDPFGFFNSYGAAANRSDELDYVQHVGGKLRGDAATERLNPSLTTYTNTRPGQHIGVLAIGSLTIRDRVYGNGTAINRGKSPSIYSLRSSDSQTVPSPDNECSSLQDYRDRHAIYRSSRRAVSVLLLNPA
jgi:alkaline phosphatase D